jgi:ubiquitin carboxyl-terminal hydrolase 7
MPTGSDMIKQEIKPNMIEALKGKQTLKAAELQDGDIVCFQRMQERKSRLGIGENRSSEEANKVSDRFEDVREYYDFLLNKKTVKFYAHPTKCDPAKYPHIELVLNSKMSYDRLSEKVAEKVGVEPTHIRFYTVNASSGNPRTAVKRGPNQTLMSILHPSGYGQLNMNQRSDALYFELLDMSLAEMDTKKNVKLTYLTEGITKEVSRSYSPMTFFLPLANH